MSQFRILILLAVLIQPVFRARADDWKEAKVDGLPCVTFNSFCQFYEFTQAPVPDDKPFTIKGIYGTLTLRSGNREAGFNGRKVWLSYPFIKKDDGTCYVSRLDVIKLFDPLLRRAEVAPRHPVKGVIIDPGHGGTDEGAKSRSGNLEKNMTLDTAMRLKEILTGQGIPVRLTRNSDLYHLLEERADIANRNPDYIFVSLHYNCSTPSAHGIEIYSLTPQYASSTSDGSYQRRSDRERQLGNDKDQLNILLSDFVYQQALKLFPQDGDRGMKRARFVVLRETKIPAVLVEGGFLSNPSDARMIATPAYRQQLAEAVALGIKNYMALMNSPVGRAPLVIQQTVTKPPAKPAPKPLQPTAVPQQVSPTPPVLAPVPEGPLQPSAITPVLPEEKPSENPAPAPEASTPATKAQNEKPAVPAPGTTLSPAQEPVITPVTSEQAKPAEPPKTTPVTPDLSKPVESPKTAPENSDVKKPVVVPSFKEWKRPVDNQPEGGSESKPADPKPEPAATTTKSN
ncbi:MAG: N-acetylmuramoyl-L-alanine amidase [Methylacidiphilales bacterium]|nr:N-acetylmuramoyl-L-alanine amidase [Candidatus Methylacidiphilales bacterium]